MSDKLFGERKIKKLMMINNGIDRETCCVQTSIKANTGVFFTEHGYLRGILVVECAACTLPYIASNLLSKSSVQNCPFIFFFFFIFPSSFLHTKHVLPHELKSLYDTDQ